MLQTTPCELLEPSSQPNKKPDCIGVAPPHSRAGLNPRNYDSETRIEGWRQLNEFGNFLRSLDEVAIKVKKPL
jgi:hypothetical protein